PVRSASCKGPGCSMALGMTARPGAPKNFFNHYSKRLQKTSNTGQVIKNRSNRGRPFGGDGPGSGRACYFRNIMSSEQFTLFEETLQSSSVWLRELAEGAGEPDERRVYQLLGAALQALRDRLPPEEAVQLGAQLPVV